MKKFFLIVVLVVISFVAVMFIESINGKMVYDGNKNQNKNELSRDDLIKKILDRENFTYDVRNQSDVEKSLLEAIKKGSRILFLNVKDYEGENINVEENVLNGWYSLRYEKPDIDYIENVEVVEKDDKENIKVRIKYIYFKDNSDEYVLKNDEFDNVIMQLDKRVLINGNSAKIDILNLNESRFEFEFKVSKQDVLKVSNMGTIETIGNGMDEIEVIIRDKKTNLEIGNVKFEINVLPKDTKIIASKEELTNLLMENKTKEIIPVYINKYLGVNDLRQGILQYEDGYTTAMFDESYTHLKYIYPMDISKEEYFSKIQEMDLKADEVIAKIIEKDMTNIQKEKAIHDYIVSNCEYDYENYINNTVPSDSRTAYGVLVNGRAICGGYSLATKLLLSKVGIKSYIVTGEGGGEAHMWNIVDIDGRYYHLDTTFDDPIVKDSNEIVHKYFNIKEKEIELDHTWQKEKYIRTE